MPPDVQEIVVGNYIAAAGAGGTGCFVGVGRQITIIVSTNAGQSDAVAYVPLNVTGCLSSILSQGTYLVNVTAQSSCSNFNGPASPCVVIQSS
jgi:hypothetical protein